MAEPVTYVPRPYVREPIVSDTRTLGALLLRQGQDAGTAAAIRGATAAQMWENLARGFQQYQNATREQAEQAATFTLRQQEREANERLKREEMAARQSEREEAARIRQEGIDRDTAIFTAENTAPGPIGRFEAEILSKFPGTAARVRGQQTLPATVTPGAMGDVSQEPGVFPVLEPTPQQARQARIDAELQANREADNKRLAQPNPPTPPAVGSFEDYLVTKYGPRPTPQQIEAARRGYTDQGRQAPSIVPPGTLPTAIQRRVDSTWKAFEGLPAVKKVQVMADSIGFAQSLDPNTTNPADDQALIYAFAKAMDPDSVVREGEYATVQKYSQSWAQKFGFDAKRVFTNTAFLTPEARANMKATIMTRFDSARNQYDAMRKSYADKINKITGSDDGDSYLTDYAAAFPAQAKKNPNR